MSIVLGYDSSPGAEAALTTAMSAGPVDALLEQADAHDARLIVVGTWGESPIRGAILGSTPHRLLHLSRRPVLCVPVGT